MDLPSYQQATDQKQAENEPADSISSNQIRDSAYGINC